MAHLHFNRTVYKSGGREASQRIAYITRQPQQEFTAAAEQLAYISRADREDLICTESRNLPGWAEGNPYTYFQAAEQYERANGNAFEEWKIMLPQEFTEQQNRQLIRALVETIAGDRLPCTYAFHCPTTMDGQRPQPHIHLLISARQNDGITRSPAQHFRRYNRAHPARGGAQKDDAFRQRRTNKLWRVTVSDVINLHLERVGMSARVHPDRLEDRGLDRKPEPRLTPKQSREYREQGKVSKRVQEVLEVREQRKAQRPTEQVNARQYWEHRRAELGITRDMAMPEQLAAVCGARKQTREHAPARTVAEGYAGVEQDDRQLGDLAHEVLMQAESEAQVAWDDMQNQHDARVLSREARGRVQELRTEVQDLWADVEEEQTLRDLGTDALEDAWRDAALLWAEETGARALHDMGWDAVQEAHEQGETALASASREYEVRQRAYEARQQARAWERMVNDLQALAARLDNLSADDGAGHGIRVRLWEREREKGLSF